MPMSIDEADWVKFHDQSKDKDVVAYGLGIHPWYAHLAAPGWQDRLRTALQAEPNISIVGECGLDRVAKTKETGATEWDTQLQVFYEQMQVAAELQRPVSLHCVRGHSFVYEWLRNQEKEPEKERQAKNQEESNASTTQTLSPYPPSLAFHSYTGSSEMATSLLRLPQVGKSVYFGFSASVNLKTIHTESKCREVLRTLPPDRILLESDLDKKEAVPGAMTRICDFVAQSIGMEKTALMELTTSNAARFLMRRSFVL